MIAIKAVCDNCEKEKIIEFGNLIPDYQTIYRLLRKSNWEINEFAHYCSSKCEDDFQKKCDHIDIFERSGYITCFTCGKTWEPDYDSMRKE